MNLQHLFTFLGIKSLANWLGFLLKSIGVDLYMRCHTTFQAPTEERTLSSRNFRLPNWLGTMSTQRTTTRSSRAKEGERGREEGERDDS